MTKRIAFLFLLVICLLLPALSDLRAGASASATPGRGYPCVVVQRQNNAFGGALKECFPRLLADVEVNDIEVDLRSGMLVIRKTDLFIPDVVPVALTRCHRLWKEWHSRVFGLNTSNAWDMNPTGSRWPYTYIDLHLCDGDSIHYRRISKGVGFADAVYEHQETRTRFFGARVRWNGNGWDFSLRDGLVLLFPEAYLAMKPVEGALVGMRNAEGYVVKAERDQRRNLKRIVSANGRFIALERDWRNRIVRTFDDQERAVKYTYDPNGRLVLVEGPNSATRYSYDGERIGSVEEDGRRVIEVRYVYGRVSEIAFPNRKSYRFRYDFDPDNRRKVLRAFVTSPDGSVTTIKF